MVIMITKGHTLRSQGLTRSDSMTKKGEGCTQKDIFFRQIEGGKGQRTPLKRMNFFSQPGCDNAV